MFVVGTKVRIIGWPFGMSSYAHNFAGETGQIVVVQDDSPFVNVKLDQVVEVWDSNGIFVGRWFKNGFILRM
jgi:ribosomal protein L21E